MTTRPPDYFLAPARAAALRAECESWRDTPFRERSGVKGPLGGVDCAGFLAATLLAIGAVSRAIAIPPYSLNHAEHSEESMFREWFALPAARARVRPLDEAEPHLDGDIVFPVVGRCEHHAGFRFGSAVLHIARPSGWCESRLSQLKLHRSRYRLTESAA